MKSHVTGPAGKTPLPLEWFLDVVRGKVEAGIEPGKARIGSTAALTTRLAGKYLQIPMTNFHQDQPNPFAYTTDSTNPFASPQPDITPQPWSGWFYLCWGPVPELRPLSKEQRRLVHMECMPQFFSSSRFGLAALGFVLALFIVPVVVMVPLLVVAWNSLPEDVFLAVIYIGVILSAIPGGLIYTGIMNGFLRPCYADYIRSQIAANTPSGTGLERFQDSN